MSSNRQQPEVARRLAQAVVDGERPAAADIAQNLLKAARKRFLRHHALDAPRPEPADAFSPFIELVTHTPLFPERDRLTHQRYELLALVMQRAAEDHLAQEAAVALIQVWLDTGIPLARDRFTLLVDQAGARCALCMLTLAQLHFESEDSFLSDTCTELSLEARAAQLNALIDLLERRTAPSPALERVTHDVFTCSFGGAPDEAARDALAVHLAVELRDRDARPELWEPLIHAVLTAYPDLPSAAQLRPIIRQELVQADAPPSHTPLRARRNLRHIAMLIAAALLTLLAILVFVLGS